MIRQWMALSKLGRFQFYNKMKTVFKERPVMAIFLSLMGISCFWIYLLGARWLVHFIYFQDVYGVLLASKLIQILLYISVGISLVSSLTTAMTHFYLSKDLEFQFSLPVNFNTWFLFRFSQVYIQSNWMLLMFGSPLLLLFLYYSETGPHVWFLGLLIFALLSAFPIFIASFLCLLLVKIFPARRVQQVFLVLTVVIVSSLVLMFRMLEPEKFVGPGGLAQFRGLIDLVSIDQNSKNPAVWAYHAIAALSQKEWGIAFWRPFAQVVGLFFLVAGVFVGTARKLYRSSWDRALQSLSGEGDLSNQNQKIGFLSRKLSHPRWSQEVREILLFLRDPSQWSQIFTLSALLALCLYSLTKIPFDPFGASRFQLAMAATAMVNFICLSIASRFVFTSFSADGQAIWLMKTTPEGWGKFVRGKLLVFGLPVFIFTILLTECSGLILSLSPKQLLILGLHCFWDSAICIMLSLVFGMLFINPSIENPVKMIVSPGGVLLMIAGLFITALHVFMRCAEWSQKFNVLLMHIGWPDVQDGHALYWYTGMILFEVSTLGYLLKRGINHLSKGDYL